MRSLILSSNHAQLTFIDKEDRDWIGLPENPHQRLCIIVFQGSMAWPYLRMLSAKKGHRQLYAYLYGSSTISG